MTFSFFHAFPLVQNPFLILSFPAVEILPSLQDLLKMPALLESFLGHQQKKLYELSYFTCISIIMLIMFYYIFTSYLFYYIRLDGDKFFLLYDSPQVVQYLKHKNHRKCPLNYMMFNIVFSFILVWSLTLSFWHGASYSCWHLEGCQFLLWKLLHLKQELTF